MSTPDALLRSLIAEWPRGGVHARAGGHDAELEAALAGLGASAAQPIGTVAATLATFDGLAALEAAADWLSAPAAEVVLVRASDADAVEALLAPRGYDFEGAEGGWVALTHRALRQAARAAATDDGEDEALGGPVPTEQLIEELRQEIAATRALAAEARDALFHAERTAISLVAALRATRHEQARALKDQKAELTDDPAWRVGRAVLAAKSPRDWMALPRAVGAEKTAKRRAKSKVAPPPPLPLEVGPLIATATSRPHWLAVIPGRPVLLAGRVIGAVRLKIPVVALRVRYIDAAGRVVEGDAPAEQPIPVDFRRRFHCLLTPPPGGARAEIAFLAGRGDTVHVGLELLEQGDRETIERLAGQLQAEAAQPDLMARLDDLNELSPAVRRAKMEAKARRTVQHLKRRLLALGFGRRVIEDFERVIAETPHDYLRALAAWELAVWRANQYTDEDARECLRLLEVVETTGELDDAWRRRIAVLRAESQSLIGDAEAAWFTLDSALQVQSHADLHLALTRLESGPDARLESINRSLTLHGLETASFAEGDVVYDRLHAEAEPVESPARVSIIIPAYNAEATIGTAIRSLQGQSWTDIEILVSDDCSTDNTAAVVEAFAAADPRVKLVHGVSNSGPYVARNHALKVATGDFVTCNDSDDWSHPRKIEMQARHLLDYPHVFANTSPQARTNEDLVFHRRGNPGFYLQPNMSSLMFRREPALEQLGYWDSIRFGADSEYLRRIKAVFGVESVVDLDCGPLSFQRQTDTSLTGQSAFGYHGFKMGARRTYEENVKRHHRSGGSLKIGFPLDERPFLAPEPMLPDRQLDREARRHFDVVMVSDFRLPGGTNMSNAEEIKAHNRMGLKTGLMELSVYHLNPERPLNPRVLELIDGRSVEMLVHGEKIACDMLIVRLPWVLDQWQQYVPDIEARAVRVIVNQPPQRDYAPGSEKMSDIGRCAVNLERYFGRPGSWHPIGPLVRDALVTHHAEDLKGIELGDIWPNIINVDEWRRPARPPGHPTIRIARHSRDAHLKWPDTVDDLLAIYPDDPKFEIHVLGGAASVETLLERPLPANWTVSPFGAMHPRDFLTGCDVFVYFTHSTWVESFGRVIFEAMAVGLPVFLPPIYRPLFQEAAIYAEPHEVRAKVEALMADDAAYQAQVERAWADVETHFGYAQHAIRIGAAMGRDLLPRLNGPAVSAA
jgi:glycosyltransferase involved in cell wall biosynthesis